MQVFNIKTAANGFYFFADGVTTYITKIFDITTDSIKLQTKDFSSLAGITSGNGFRAKHNYSYKEIENLIKLTHFV